MDQDSYAFIALCIAALGIITHELLETLAIIKEARDWEDKQ